MAHSTGNAAAPNTPATRTDWYAFLRSALIDGFKAYGASLMVIAPADPAETRAAIPSSPRSAPSPRITDHQFSRSLNTLPLAPLAKPAWRHA